MRKLLSDEEINKIFEIKKNKKNNTLCKVYEDIKKEIFGFKVADYSEIYHLILNAIGVHGNVENNDENLICPECNSVYVAKYLYGDVFYRLFNGSAKQKRDEIKKFEKMGLFINIDCYKKEDNGKHYCCISCGYEW